MIFKQKTIQLKNGEECILRSPVPEEAGDIMKCLTACAGETEFIIRYPEECTETDEQEAAFLQILNESATRMMIVAVINGEIAGNCQLIMNSRQKTKHRASVAISLIKKYWGLGIGTAMFRELIETARQQGVTQLELEFIEGNTRAQALYEKMGFRIVAERPNAVRLKDGRLLKDYFMVKELQ